MNQYLVAFITGLTTGGLSCLAVQGGLLASSLEQMMEAKTPVKSISKNKRRVKAYTPSPALPIVLFLAAKVFTYTVLGLLLGALGSVFQLSTFTRAILLIGIGIFMVGNALRMFNIHPIFRYFVVEPPKFITRYIRRTSKGGSDTQHGAITPLFLGALTVLIPCGVTQAMMAVAIASGNPMQGAMLMLAFTLGTTPVFFIVSYLATSLGQRTEGLFMRFVAVVVLFLGFVSVDSGFTLMGFPYSINNMVANAFQSAPADVAGPVSQDGTLTLVARSDGYFPRHLRAPANQALTLNVVTKETYSCARAFVIPDLNVERVLPATGTVPIQIPPQRPGTIMQFTCSMGMYTGQIEFTE
jgi:sulfite exporter TauE/SafE